MIFFFNLCCFILICVFYLNIVPVVNMNPPRVLSYEHMHTINNLYSIGNGVNIWKFNWRSIFRLQNITLLGHCLQASTLVHPRWSKPIFSCGFPFVNIFQILFLLNYISSNNRPGTKLCRQPYSFGSMFRQNITTVAILIVTCLSILLNISVIWTHLTPKLVAILYL